MHLKLTHSSSLASFIKGKLFLNQVTKTKLETLDEKIAHQLQNKTSFKAEKNRCGWLHVRAPCHFT